MSAIEVLHAFFVSSAALAGLAYSMDQPIAGADSFNLTPDEQKTLIAAANKGQGEPALRLYRYYDFVKLNHPEAIKWLKKSAESGSPQGQYIMGFFYRNDPAIKDSAKAKYWLEKSAKNGYGPAREALK